MKKLLSDKTERLLSLEKGSFDVFSKVIGKKKSKPDETESHEYKKNIAKKAKRKTIKKKKSEENYMSEDEKVLLDFESHEICRICLRNDKSLTDLFMTKFVEMYKYCFSIQVNL